jgi:hypothetical protein
VLDDAGRAIVEEFSSLATSVAWEFKRKAARADIEELEAIAYAGLVEAAERFPRYQPSTATPWMIAGTWAPT